VRRLAPDCSRIELASLPRERDEERLLHAMGWETANIHLGSAKAGVLAADLRKRSRRWLADAAAAMVKSVEADWQEWRVHQSAAATEAPRPRAARTSSSA
jgi:Uncharacterized protein conserved in bacteria (DUF2252)